MGEPICPGVRTDVATWYSKWLKQMVVGAIDEHDLRGSLAQRLGCGQPAEASPYDDDSWLWHNFPDSIGLLS